MKKLAKTIAMLLCMVLCMSALFACGGSGENEDEAPDATKTQLYVEVVDVGTGTKYVENLAKRFEEKVKDESFETGKKGLEIRITPRKGYLSVDSFTAKEYDVFFNYGSAALQDWIRDGHVLDITSVVDKTLTEYGETRSIKDKLFEGAENFYGRDGKIYGLPNFVYPFGISYDQQVFEDNKLFIGDSGEYVNGKGNKSAGQDGVKGTYDDGLPTTYDEFFALCDKMLEKGLQPLTWTGTYRDYYLESFVQALHVDADGYEQSRLMYTFDGTATTLVDSIDGSGNVTLKAPTAISNENGYELWSQAGMYYATSFIGKMMQKNAGGSYYYDYNKQHGTYSNIEAQEDFLMTPYETTSKTIAMLVEGTYWEQEISEYGTFEFMEGNFGEEASRANRKLAFMPLPKPTKEMVGTGHTVVDDIYGVVLGNNHMDEFKKDIAREFIQFCYTDESLQETTVTTSLFFSLDYKLSDANYEKLSGYGKSVADFMTADDTKVVLTMTNNRLYMDNIATFDCHRRYSSTKCDKMFKNLADGNYSAKEIFEGMKSKVQAGWDDYSKYFN